MPWFNVDDGFSNSKPVMKIPRRWRPTCLGVWVLCGSWSAKELTDGHVPNSVLKEYGGTPAVVQMLIDADLWERDVNGVIFKGWSKWQVSKDRVTSHRMTEAERKRKYRKGKQQTPPDLQERENVPDMSRWDTCGSPGGTHAGVPVGQNGPSPSPILNSPCQVTSELGGGSGGNPTNAPRKRSAPTNRGTRLPLDWRPTDEVWSQMRTEQPNVDLEYETKKFIDYWQSKAGAAATRIDWNKTWRNWIRTAAERQHGNRNRPAIQGADLRAIENQKYKTDQLFGEIQ